MCRYGENLRIVEANEIIMEMREENDEQRKEKKEEKGRQAWVWSGKERKWIKMEE